MFSFRTLLACCAFWLGGSAAFAEPADYDVVVVGGGPAGAVTALRLSQKGHRVLVVEKRDRERSRDPIVGIKAETAATLAELGAAPSPEQAARYVKGIEPVAPDPDPIKFMLASYSTHTMKIADLETALYTAGTGNKNIELRFNTTLEAAPALGNDGLVDLSIKDDLGAVHPVRTRYLVVSDGAGSPTLESMGVAMRVYARGKLAAAFFKQKGRNVIDFDSGVARLADNDSTYTLTALPATAQNLDGTALEHFVRQKASQVGIKRGAKLLKSWTFDATMQRAGALLLLDDHVMVIGDAASTPHPLTGMGVNKAIHEAELTATSLGDLLGSDSAEARHTIAAGWRRAMIASTTSLHHATLPLFRLFGTIDKRPFYLSARRANPAGARLHAPR